MAKLNFERLNHSVPIQFLKNLALFLVAWTIATPLFAIPLTLYRIYLESSLLNHHISLPGTHPAIQALDIFFKSIFYTVYFILNLILFIPRQLSYGYKGILGQNSLLWDFFQDIQSGKIKPKAAVVQAIFASTANTAHFFKILGRFIGKTVEFILTWLVATPLILIPAALIITIGYMKQDLKLFQSPNKTLRQEVLNIIAKILLGILLFIPVIILLIPLIAILYGPAGIFGKDENDQNFLQQILSMLAPIAKAPTVSIEDLPAAIISQVPPAFNRMSSALPDGLKLPVAANILYQQIRLPRTWAVDSEDNPDFSPFPAFTVPTSS